MRCAILPFLVSLLILPAAPSFGQHSTDPSPPHPEFEHLNLGFENAPDAKIEPLLEKLGSPDFATRKSASKRLTEIGPPAFTLLSRHYREHDDFEVRLRIQSVVKDQYLWHTLLKHKGFMGVAYTPHTGSPLGEDVTAIVINNVTRGSAAHEAGLAPMDLILSVNGKSTNDLIGDATFGHQIQAKGAGGKITLSIMRRGQVQDVTFRLKARPVEQYVTPPLLDELNSRMQSYSIWWDKHFSLPRTDDNRLPSSEVLQIPKPPQR